MVELSQQLQTPTSNQQWLCITPDPPKMKKKTKPPPHIRSVGFRGRRLMLEDPNGNPDSKDLDTDSHSPSCPLGEDADTGAKCECFTPIKQD